MPAPGANLQYGANKALFARILRVLGFRHFSVVMPKQATSSKSGGILTDLGTTFPRAIGICMKTSAPANDTAADAPTGVGDLCLVVVGNWPACTYTLYRSTAYVSTTSHTWTQVV